MSRATLALVCVLGGCDSLFNLDHVPPGGGGSADGDAMTGDGRGSGSAGDASSCGTFDEDGDGIFDLCDACPAIASTNLDVDMDGLPDACDPNIGPNMDASGNKLDKILFRAMFSTQADLDDNFNAPVGGVVYLSTNSAISVSGDGMASGAVLVTKQQFSPTKIELNVGGLGGGVYANEVSIVEPQVTCHILGTGCDMANTNQTCFYVVPTSKATHQQPNSQLLKLELIRNGGTMTTCRVGGSSSTSTSGSGSLSLSTIQIAVSRDASVKILSMIVYGSGP